MKIELPEKVKVISEKLKVGGFEAFAVGGCVRDSITGAVPNDWDICTDAKPEQIKHCFCGFNTFDSGIKHGTISIVIDKEVFEVTTYRIDGEYTDNRRPDSVTFTTDIIKDLARRDFTINAMAYNDECGLIDPFGGRDDLAEKTLRCVGNPNLRFGEDALRIIRALRFASVLNLKIEKSTSLSIYKNAELLKNISAERISAELNRLLCGDRAEEILNCYRNVFAVFIPEIKPMFDYDQHTKHHNRDVWKHTTCSVGCIEKTPLLRMTMLLHDIGKPDACKRDSDGTCHFKGHPKHSAQKAELILRRLKYPTEFIEACTTLIKYHDVRLSGAKRQLRHIMNAIGEENTALLMKIQRADILAQSEYKRREKLEKLDLACRAYDEVLADKDCFTLKQLDINGADIMRIGVEEGIKVGRILKMLLSLVMEDKLENEKSALLKKAEELRDEL